MKNIILIICLLVLGTAATAQQYHYQLLYQTNSEICDSTTVWQEATGTILVDVGSNVVFINVNGVNHDYNLLRVRDDGTHIELDVTTSKGKELIIQIDVTSQGVTYFAIYVDPNVSWELYATKFIERTEPPVIEEEDNSKKDKKKKRRKNRRRTNKV